VLIKSALNVPQTCLSSDLFLCLWIKLFTLDVYGSDKYFELVQKHKSTTDVYSAERSVVKLKLSTRLQKRVKLLLIF
jgi:hypothetical protein